MKYKMQILVDVELDTIQGEEQARRILYHTVLSGSCYGSSGKDTMVFDTPKYVEIKEQL